MSNGKMSRVKGKVGEREVVNILKASDIPAKRISPMESGGVDKGDLLIADVWKGSVKYGNHVPEFIYTARENGEQFLFMRKIGKSCKGRKWIIAMDLDFFLKHFL